MFYCPKCLNIYNITKSVKTKEELSQQGGNNKIDDIIQKLLENDTMDDYKFSESDLHNLEKSQNYKKLSAKQKDYIYNFINDKVEKYAPKNQNTSHKNMYFICKNCGNHEVIKDGTIIASKENAKNTVSEITFNAKEYLQMPILPRTRQYDCPNDKCESHKNAAKKSAAFMRLTNSYKMRYICESCETAWMIS
jgi:hypothetical protein